MNVGFPLKNVDMNLQTVSTVVCSSDSTSDDDVVPVRKTRSRTIRRGLSCNKTQTETKTVSKPVPEVSLYSTRVIKCLQDCKAGKIHIDLEEDDTEESLPKTKVVSSNSISSNESTDDDLQLIQKISNVPTRTSQSPSPPPPPRIVREKKRTKKMKTAIKKLDAARNILQGSVVEDNDDDDDVVLLEESPVQEKQNMVVMVRYKETVHRFPMKRWDPFCYTMAKLAEVLHVPQNQVVLLLKDKTVSSSDTPASVNLHIADIIDCHVYAAKPLEPEDDEAEISDPDIISLCVQCLSSKSRVTVSTNRYQPLRTLMVKFAVMKKIELSYLRFQFDGEDLLPSATPESLDMEDGDCIDAIEL
ncbi:NFATC2-interacting protein-like [Gigantopelta aegis]|uniref:NFATC2-interacting protein-like n=1 Tax=Gigantopelta aegis TaxID=1735272 RepID=UPI001B889743|nr:NFATC2-interacting protein-like [Gigantopelta aegis]